MFVGAAVLVTVGDAVGVAVGQGPVHAVGVAVAVAVEVAVAVGVAVGVKVAVGHGPPHGATVRDPPDASVSMTSPASPVSWTEEKPTLVVPSLSAVKLNKATMPLPFGGAGEAPSVTQRNCTEPDVIDGPRHCTDLPVLERNGPGEAPTADTRLGS